MSLLLEIDGFLRRTGMPPTTFGRRAVGDPRLIGDLKRGRQLRPGTRARVCAYLASGDAR